MLTDRSTLLFLTCLLVLPACGGGGEKDSGGAATRVSFHADGALAAIQEFIHARQNQADLLGKIDTGAPRWKYKLPKPPTVEFTPGKTYYWDLKTSAGSMRVRLLHEQAPAHVSNLIYLTLLGFYDDTIFHRAMQRFMVQGGCPSGNGRGDPGYKLDLEIDPDLSHDRPGILAAANSGPNTDGSQFYLLFAPSTFLDGDYTIYGEMTDGMVTLRAMEKVSAPQGDESQAPTVELKLEKATITVE